MLFTCRSARKVMEIYTTVDTEKTPLSWECLRFACKADQSVNIRNL